MTGHARTLSLASAPASIAKLKILRDSDALHQAGLLLELEGDQIRVSTELQDIPPSHANLTWCFGSGEHACTWTQILPDSSGASDELEFRWSWYHQDSQVAITPGQPPAPTKEYYGHLGILFDNPKAIRCFSCHTSHLPMDQGKIDEANLVPGIACQRCHGPRETHVKSSGDYSNPQWKIKDQNDAINRCAQCHRRADEMLEGAITADNKSIARFQPVGLVQSKCFQNSQMTCTTCHDPHLPMSAQDSLGIWQCIQCHDSQHPDHVICASGEPDDCIRCHMPKVAMQAPVSFSDHWIRVRNSPSHP